MTAEPLKEDRAALDNTLSRFIDLWDFERASRALVHRYENTLRYPRGQGLINALWRTLICDMNRDVAGDLTRPAPSSFADSYSACLRLQDLMTNADIDAATRDDFNAVDKMSRVSQPFVGAFEPAARGRRFCVTQDGYMGLVPTRAAMGDNICVFLGGAVPFVMRKTDNRHYFLVGECYLHGLMDGKALEMVLDVDWMDERDITLE